MRRAVGRVVPGVAIAREFVARARALVGHEAFERGEPVPVVGVAGVWIAGCLCGGDLRGERLGPLDPGEEAALMQRQRHREGLCFPGLLEHRAVGVARHARRERHVPGHATASR
jgi:hypothetical protein